MDNVKTILSKYWVGILCLVIALIAFIANFVPLQGYHDELQKKLTDSAAKYTAINTLLNPPTPRRLPALPGQDEGDVLKLFPSESIIKSGQAIGQALDTESKKAYQLVLQMNTHTQLVPGVLPSPVSIAPMNFRKAYNDQLWPGGIIQSKVLQAGFPPSKESIDKEKARQLKEVFEPQIYRDPSGTPMNADQIKDKYDQAMAVLPLQMQQTAAENCKVYLNPDAIQIEPNVSSPTGPTPLTPSIWWAQLALWCQQDICQAISEANASAKNVTDAPIKRIWKIDLPPIGPSLLFVGKGAMGAGAGGPTATDPNAVATLLPAGDPNAAVQPDIKLSPTGRSSNALYDVIQFRLDLTVSFKDLPTVLEVLSRKRLITVLNVETLTPDDAKAAEKDGFLYGPSAVSRVTIRCEELFLRDWTTPLMPDSIKKILSIALPPTPGA